MADNVTTGTPVSSVATGTVIATHKGAASENYQRMQIADGSPADGVTPILATVTGSGLQVDVTKVVPGTGATNLGKAEDAPHTTGDTGVAIWAVRTDAPAASSGTDGDYEAIHTDDHGRVRVLSDGNIKTVTTTAAGLTTGATPYTAGDMLGTQWTFTDIAAWAGGAFELMSATLVCTTNTPPVGPTDLFLFNTSVTQAADNAANSWSDADMLLAVGVISFPSPIVGGGGLNSIATLPSIQFFGETAASTNLFGGLVTRIGHAQFGAATDLTIRLVVKRV